MSGKRPRTIDEAEDDRCFGPLPQEDILREDLRAITAERDSLKAELARMVEATVEILVQHDICPPSRIDPDHGAICPEFVRGMTNPGRCEACYLDHLDSKAKEKEKHA